MENYDKYIDEIFETDKNRYKVTKYIAKGGNGYIFECNDTEGNEFVLKILYNLKKIDKFKKEIELQKNINSEYVVRCVDSGERRTKKETKSRFFYIMKKYDCTLEDAINKHELTPSKAYKFCIQLSEGLKALHKHQPSIIHRDLKPENILFDKKDDKVLIGDCGLARLSSDKFTLNSESVGNYDYHAPEQKKGSKTKVGTYTDIYSLGLIFNVLFTNKIPQGELYMKIWEVHPYFSFIDDIVKRMIVQDASIREDDISVVLRDLKENELMYEFEKSLLENEYKKILPLNKQDELIDLFYLLEYAVHNLSDWTDINLNYYCDYHFYCDKILEDSILLNAYYKRIRAKFDNEGGAYKNNISCEVIDLKTKENISLFNSFCEIIDNLYCFSELSDKKNIIKKYFCSLKSYHCKEIFKDFEEVANKIKYYCEDAPILCIAYCIKENLNDFKAWNYYATKYVILKKYVKSDVIDKYKFRYNTNLQLTKLKRTIKKLFNSSIIAIKRNELTVSFDNIKDECSFEKLLLKISDLYGKSITSEDVKDIIKKARIQNFNRIYTIDNFGASSILKKL